MADEPPCSMEAVMDYPNYYKSSIWYEEIENGALILLLLRENKT